MPFFCPGEAAGEFLDVAGADQLAGGGVIAGRQRPVIAGCPAAPDPPPRVHQPEPLELGIRVIRAVAGVHRGRLHLPRGGRA